MLATQRSNQPAQGEINLRHCLNSTLAISTTLIAVAVILNSARVIPPIAGNALIGVGSPFFTLSLMGRIGTHKTLNEPKKWAITALAAAAILIVGIIFSSVGFPGAIGNTLIGLSTSVLTGSLFAYFFSRYRAGLPLMPEIGCPTSWTQSRGHRLGYH